MNYLYTRKVIAFIAEEVTRQSGEPMDVVRMYDAWHFASRAEWSVETVLKLGELIDPVRNASGFRTIPVSFGDGTVLDAVRIPERVEMLMEHMSEFGNVPAAEAFYQAFESIHPFRDGNGRVGAILYNMLLERMSDPKTPPKFRRG